MFTLSGEVKEVGPIEGLPLEISIAQGFWYMPPIEYRFIQINSEMGEITILSRGVVLLVWILELKEVYVGEAMKVTDHRIGNDHGIMLRRRPGAWPGVTAAPR